MLAVFDLDDTLFLERDYARSGFRAVGRYAEQRGIGGVSRAAWRLFREGVRGTIFDQALEELDIPRDEELIQSLVDVYRKHIPDISMEADAEDCLLRVSGFADLALVTDGSSQSQWNKVRSLGLPEIIRRIIVTADLGPDAAKPSPAAFRLLEEGRKDELRIYIGDNPVKDFVGPRSLGWRSIRIRRIGGLWADVEDDPTAAPDVVLPDLARVPEILAGWEMEFSSGTLPAAGHDLRRP
jgi:putative hydrolase of the HAD superfamily